MTELTEKQAKLHAYLCSRWNDPPTFQEMADYLGVASKNGVTCHIKALEAKGYVKQPDDKRARGVILLRGPDLDGTDIEIAGMMYRLVRLEGESTYVGSQPEAESIDHHRDQRWPH